MGVDYTVGSTIEYEPFGGGIRSVLVDLRSSDIKNGAAGFEGREVGGRDDGALVWGYDEQVTRVVR